MTLLVAGNAAVLDLVLQGDRMPGNAEVGMLLSSPGAAGWPVRQSPVIAGSVRGVSALVGRPAHAQRRARR